MASLSTCSTLHVEYACCRRLQEEFEASGADYILYRPLLHDLIAVLESGEKLQIYLDGPAGKDEAAVTKVASHHWMIGHSSQSGF